MATINDSVQYLKGVGPAFAKSRKVSNYTIRDLLLCYPRKYIDYTCSLLPLCVSTL